jgi:hypothetical protein
VEVPVLLLKALSLIATAILAVLAFRHLQAAFGELSAMRARVRPERQRQRRDAVRLRQDPRTGVYYPEN